MPTMIVLLSRLAVLTVIATTLATAAALGARADWLLELFSHFPVQYLCLQFLAAVACLALRQWPWALVALVAAVPNLLAVGPYLPGLRLGAGDRGGRHGSRASARPAGRRQPPATGRKTRRPRARTSRRQSADLLVLSEFTPRWREKLRDLERTYPYFALRPRWNPWGIAVYSKHPLRAIEDLDLGDDSELPPPRARAVAGRPGRGLRRAPGVTAQPAPGGAEKHPAAQAGGADRGRRSGLAADRGRRLQHHALLARTSGTCCVTRVSVTAAGRSGCTSPGPPGRCRCGFRSTTASPAARWP